MNKSDNAAAARVVLSILCVAVLVFLDQLTKHLAVLHLKGKESFVLIPQVLEFRYLENRGAAFSLFQNQQVFFYILTGAFLFFAIFVIRRMPPQKRYLPLRICLLVLIAGACGNLIDRILHKYVVDFIYFSLIDFPIFNAADIYVTLSVITLILLVIFKYKEEDFTFLKRRTEHE